MIRRVVCLFLSIVIMANAVVTTAHAEERWPGEATDAVTALNEGCGDLETSEQHHTPTRFLREAIAELGSASPDPSIIHAWSTPEKLFVAYYVVECGRWLIAIFRTSGYGFPKMSYKGTDYEFVTHFFPRAGWAYIVRQVAKTGASAIDALETLVGWWGTFLPTLFMFIVPPCPPDASWTTPCVGGGDPIPASVGVDNYEKPRR